MSNDDERARHNALASRPFIFLSRNKCQYPIVMSAVDFFRLCARAQSTHKHGQTRQWNRLAVIRHSRDVTALRVINQLTRMHSTSTIPPVRACSISPSFSLPPLPRAPARVALNIRRRWFSTDMSRACISLAGNAPSPKTARSCVKRAFPPFPRPLLFPCRINILSQTDVCSGRSRSSLLQSLRETHESPANSLAPPGRRRSRSRSNRASRAGIARRIFRD